MARPVSLDDAQFLQKFLHPRMSSESASETAFAPSDSSATESEFIQSKAVHTATRRSRTIRFSLLSNISDFASLIRSHSTSTGRRLQRPDITNKAFFSGDADHIDSDTQNRQPVLTPSLDMLSSSRAHEERPSGRKLKKENRLYSFLTRSRSRSQSKNELEAAQPTVPDVPVPSNPRQSHSGTRPQSGSKPASRIPSRPLSSTTSTTNTTITPGTPTPKKRRPHPSSPANEAHSPSSTPDITPTRSKPHHTPHAAPPAPVLEPTPPKHSGARQKLHDLFGIPLGRKSTQSRSRSRSRPSSPVGGDGGALRPLPEVPPLPTAGVSGADEDVTPRPRKHVTAGSMHYSARPRSRSVSPTPETQTRVLRVTNESSTGSQGTATTAASVKISRFFSTSIKSRSNTPPNSNSGSKRSSRPSTANETLPSSSAGTTSAPMLPPIPTVSSLPSLSAINLTSSSRDLSAIPNSNPSPKHRRSNSAKDTLPPLPQAQSPPPRITHTPATPLKTADNDKAGPASKLPAAVPTRLAYHAAKGSLDSGYRYRAGGGPTMSRLTEEGSSARGSGVGDGLLLPIAALAPTSRDKEKDRSRATGGGSSLATGDVGQPIPVAVPRTGLKMSSSMRATKHGSFDFERPGAMVGAVSMQRSGSGGTTETSGTGRSSVSAALRERERERESVYGPGLAGVGTLQREASMRRAQDREEMLRLKERARKLGLDDKGKEKERDKGRASTSQRTTPQGSATPSDPVHASTSTGRSTGTAGATPAGGKSSSMSHATGAKRSLLPKHRTSVKRLVGLTPAQHGPFSFEPAVPSPTRSNSSMGTVHEPQPLPAGWASKAEKERERVSQEKERQRDYLLGRRRSGATAGDRAPVPVPGVSSSSESSSPALSGFVPVGSPTTLYTAKNGQAYNSGSLGKASGTKIPISNAGHRSGAKGRSLDLGLGLSWAPSKVREAALLPASGFFGRTVSGTSASSGPGMERTPSGTSSSGGGRSGNGSGSTNGLGRNASVRAPGERDVERSKAGKEVAAVFKNALDPQEYVLFKRYVHQFDAHEIPFDGPMGIVTLVEGLLVSAPHLGEDGKRRLLDKFIRILLQQA